MTLGATQADLLMTETLTVGSSKFVVRFYGPAEFCEYDSFSIEKNGKKVFSLKDRCGRQIKERGPSVVAEGKWVKAVKLGSHSSDIYLHFLEEPTNYVFQTLLLTTDEKISVAFSGKISGEFQDFNGDGQLDLVKQGGRGEPTGAAFSYDPYLVYLQTKKAGKVDFKLNEVRSKEFSTANQFEWHGTKYDATIRVDARGTIVK